MDPFADDIEKVLISEEEIQAKLAEMGATDHGGLRRIAVCCSSGC